MTGKGRGSGKTPERLVKLLQEAVAESNQSKVASETGLTRLTLQNYLKGIGEPTTATLIKLGDYFGVSVAWLRGETPDTGLFKSYTWPTGYDMWAIALSSAEVVLRGALQSRESILKDNESLNSVVDVAVKILNMSDEVAKLFHPEHLKEVQELAKDVLGCLKVDKGA